MHTHAHIHTHTYTHTHNKKKVVFAQCIFANEAMMQHAMSPSRTVVDLDMFDFIIIIIYISIYISFRIS